MTEQQAAGGAFTVSTIELDLPALVGALSRRLHDAGLPMTPARSAQLARALTLLRPISRTQLYWATRAVLVSDHAQLPAFDAVFAAIFGAAERPTPVQLEDAAQTVQAPPPERDRDRDGAARAAAAGHDRRAQLSSSGPSAADDDEQEAAQIEVPLAMASDDERLASKRFDSLEPAELAQLYRLMARLTLATPLRRTRRQQTGRRGRHVDMRRTLRASLHSGGDPIRLARRHRRMVRRRLVVLCDISGSMEPYARAYLQFLTCAAGSGRDAEAFAFATRLTRLTRALASRNPQRAIARAATTAPDWSSGTRIGDALKAFNDRHGRRGMAHGAVVVIISDGWERGEPLLLAREMERLARLAYRIVWVNPRVGADAFSVQAGGMRAALPYCDDLVSGHSLHALGAVADAIASPRLASARGRGSATHSAAAAAATSDAEETWASATPVAGSSVSMPSGYGPSKGNTTPGWVTDT